jgi:hypothetical protein
MKNKKAFYTLLSTQMIYGLFLIVWMFFAGMSVMMFDSPGSENSVLLWAIFSAIVAYPLGLIVGVIMSWINYSRQKYKRAYWYNCIPLIWVVPIIGFLGYANFID